MSLKKRLIIIISIIVFVCAVVAGTLILINSKSDKATVSQTEKQETSAPTPADSKEKGEIVATDGAANSQSGKTPAVKNPSSSSANTIEIPADMSAEELEKLIEEFNTTTDEARKEEIRLILEAIFSSATEVPMN